MLPECNQCKGICDSLERSNEPNEAQDKIIRFIANYRKIHFFDEPCFGKLCLPLLKVINENKPESKIEPPLGPQ